MLECQGVELELLAVLLPPGLMLSLHGLTLLAAANGVGAELAMGPAVLMFNMFNGSCRNSRCAFAEHDRLHAARH